MKPEINKEDRETLDNAVNEYKDAQEEMHQALVEGKSTQEIDKAIKQCSQKHDIYFKLYGMYHQTLLK